MESSSLPIVIKKKNGMMISAVILEFMVGIIFGIIQGPKSLLLWLMVFVAVITGVSVLDEANELISLKENKMEVSKYKDLLKTIKYENITSISYENGKSEKDKRKKFIVVDYNIVKKKSSKEDTYLIDTSYYSKKDIREIINAMMKKNNSINISTSLKEYLQ